MSEHQIVFFVHWCPDCGLVYVGDSPVAKHACSDADDYFLEQMVRIREMQPQWKIGVLFEDQPWRIPEFHMSGWEQLYRIRVQDLRPENAKQEPFQLTEQIVAAINSAIIKAVKEENK